MAAIVTAYAGIRKALKDLKTAEGSPSTSPAVSQVVGGMIVESATMVMWSDSNRQVAEALHGLCSKLDSMINASNYNTDVSRDMNREMSELRHQIEMLRGKLQ